MRESIAEETENETRRFFTHTKSVRINATQNNDPNTSRNNSICYFLSHIMWEENQSLCCVFFQIKPNTHDLHPPN